MNALKQDLHRTVAGKGPMIRVLRSQQFSNPAEMDQEYTHLQKSGIHVVAMMTVDGSRGPDETMITRWRE